MNLSKESEEEEEFVFEFYDESPTFSLEKELPKVKDDYNHIDFEKNLNDEQLSIINNIRGPMLVIAGAGSGKTRTIVYAVAKLLKSGTRPGQIMLVTFTNKAANEMIKRVEVLLGKKPKGIWAGTFHSMANRFLRMYAKTAGLEANYTIMDNADANNLMKLAIQEANTKEIGERFPSPKMTKTIQSYMINCNKSLLDVIDWKYSQFHTPKVISKLKEVLKTYERKKRNGNLLDFDDLLVFWNGLLDQESIARLIAKRIKYVLVDEYQDTNYLQDEIISKIVNQNPDRNVMVVGDDAQSIYAFRGANFQNILNFEKRYEGCKRYSITYNYRSVPQILDLANDSIQHNVKQFFKEMRATRSVGKKPYHIDVTDDNEQARFISNQVLALRDKGIALNQMAILIRAGFHSFKIEMELREKNIPYIMRSGVTFFERAHIKDIIAHLKVIENPHDEISWTRIFTYIQGLGGTSASKIFVIMSRDQNPMKSLLKEDFPRRVKGSRVPKQGLKNLISYIKHFPGLTPEDEPSEVIEHLINVLKNNLQGKYEDWEDRIQDLRQLAIYSQNFSTIKSFLDNLSLNMSNLESKTVKAGNQKEEEAPLIISTIHRAKGLEWRVVFVPMLCEDMFPSGRIIGDEDEIEEERRVFYVAITRAKDQLYLLSPAIIQSYNAPLVKRVSQFVSELNPKCYKKAKVKFIEAENFPVEFQTAADIRKSESLNDQQSASEKIDKIKRKTKSKK